MEAGMSEESAIPTAEEMDAAKYWLSHKSTCLYHTTEEREADNICLPWYLLNNTCKTPERRDFILRVVSVMQILEG